MKGISPLIAAVLLIAFTVAIATLIMGWFSTLTRNTTGTVSNKTTEAVDCSNSQISIEDVYITNGTNGSARIIAKNTGFSDLTINSAQMFNTTGGNFSTGFSMVTDFTPGAIRTIYLTRVSIKDCPSGFSKVIVTTNCGGISDTFDGTPKCA
jgi:flagellin-like protein